MSKTTLITGAAGFLGSHLCDRFIAKDFYVIGMDNYITGDKDNIQHLLNHPNFEFIEHEPDGSEAQRLLGGPIQKRFRFHKDDPKI